MAAAAEARQLDDRDKEHVRSLLAVIRLVDGDGSAAEGDAAEVGSQTSVLAGLAELRRLLSSQMHAPIQAVIDLGGVNTLVQLLRNESCSCSVRFEAAWSLTNIACGNLSQTTALVDACAPEALFATLLSADIDNRPDLCDQCLWALGNIAGEGACLRDKLLSKGIVGVLGQLFQRIPGFTWNNILRTQTLRTMTWLMSCLCRGSPAPPIEEVDCAFDYFAQVLAGTDDAQMLSEALWGLVYLLKGAANTEDQRSLGLRFLTTGFEPGEMPVPPAKHPVISTVVSLARSAGAVNSGPAPVPALSLLGLIVSLPVDDLVDAALYAGALRTLRAVLQDRRPQQLQVEAAWAIANIAVSTPAHALRILEEDRLWLTLAQALLEGPRELCTECAWALVHLTQGGSSVLARLDTAEAMRLVAKALRTERDVDLLRALLETSEVLLRFDATEARTLIPQKAASGDCGVVTSPHGVGPAIGPVAAKVEESGLLQILEVLQHSDHKAIYSKTVSIIETWFAKAGQENEPPTKKAASCSGAGSGLRMAGATQNRFGGA